MIIKKLTLINIRKPSTKNVNEELQWFGTSLGLFSLRDKNKSRFRVFIELLKSAKNKKPLNSDEIAYNLGLSRGTVIHHINKLISAGLVVVEKNHYLLRVDNLRTLTYELEKDLKRTCEDLKEIAEDIDKWLGL